MVALEILYYFAKGLLVFNFPPEVLGFRYTIVLSALLVFLVYSLRLNYPEKFIEFIVRILQVYSCNENWLFN
jgi:hypothetical protein